MIQELGTWNPDDLTQILKDLDGDGYPELVLHRVLTPYRGARCMAAVPLVYKCSAKKCADHTRNFSRFLRQWLGETEAELAEQTKDGDEDEVACLTVSRDKVRRILGIEPHAGFELALQWLRGIDQDRREDAALVLSDIGDNEARTILSGLFRDNNASVARIAQRAEKARR